MHISRQTHDRLVRDFHNTYLALTLNEQSNIARQLVTNFKALPEATAAMCDEISNALDLTAIRAQKRITELDRLYQDHILQHLEHEMLITPLRKHIDAYWTFRTEYYRS